MDSKPFQFLNPFPIPAFHHHEFSLVTYRNDHISRRCSHGGRSSGSRLNLDGNVNHNRLPRFKNDYITENCDEEDEFKFGNAAKQRIWWSDIIYEEEDEQEEEELGFGILEAVVSFDWISKVFQAFGWMIPAVIISLVSGTGPNAIFMALAPPLAQTLFSLLTETLWGKSSRNLKSKTKNKNKAFSKATSNTRPRKGKETRTQSGDYKSWVTPNIVLDKNKNRDSRNFGGWDDLDNYVRVKKVPNVVQAKEASDSRIRDRVTRSKRIDVKGVIPLLIRMLIDAFPLLGFWDKLL